MVSVDERQAAASAAAAEVNRLSGDHATTVAALKVEQQGLAVQLNRLMEKRPRQAALAQRASLELYDKLTQEKRGQAVAGLRGNKCQGCLVTISANTIRAADRGDLVLCDSCGRILYPL